MSTNDKGKLATPANILSASRIVAAPIIFYLIATAQDGTSNAATALFVAAAMTDFFDGMFARTTGSVTPLGKVLDPAADRILIGSTIVALTVYGPLPLIGVALAVTRDILMVIGYKAIERLGVSMRVSLLGKTYTALFMSAIVLTMAGAEAGGHEIGLWLFWISVGGSMLSAVNYTARGLVIWRARTAGQNSL